MEQTSVGRAKQSTHQSAGKVNLQRHIKGVLKQGGRHNPLVMKMISQSSVAQSYFKKLTVDFTVLNWHHWQVIYSKNNTTIQHVTRGNCQVRNRGVKSKSHEWSEELTRQLIHVCYLQQCCSDVQDRLMKMIRTLNWPALGSTVGSSPCMMLQNTTWCFHDSSCERDFCSLHSKPPQRQSWGPSDCYFYIRLMPSLVMLSCCHCCQLPRITQDIIWGQLSAFSADSLEFGDVSGELIWAPAAAATRPTKEGEGGESAAQRLPHVFTLLQPLKFEQG